MRHTPENSHPIHTDPRFSKERIGRPTADDIFFTEHLKKKKEARRERKELERREKVREAKARAMESIARELESAEVEKGIESLFADGEMNIQSWLARYYKAVEKSETTDAIQSVDKLRDFTKGTIISDQILYNIEHFFGEDVKLLGDEGEAGNAVDFDIISEKLEISKADVIRLVALVSLDDSSKTIKNLFKHRNDLKWDFLNKHVSDEEFAVLQKLFKDASFVDELLAELIRQNADFIQSRMSARSMHTFIILQLRSNPHICASESRDLFATEEMKQKYTSFFEKERAGALEYLSTYEFLFGELSKDEFLKFFPDWNTAKSYVYSRYEYRYELDVSTGEGESELKAVEPYDGYGGIEHTDSEVGKLSGRVRVVPERRILELLDGRAEQGVSHYISAYTQKKPKSEQKALSLQSHRRTTPNLEVFVPYERDAVRYIDAARVARERMEQDTDEGQRLRIFFADVWPQLLIARADEVVNNTLLEEVDRSIELLDDKKSSLRRQLSGLARLSEDPYHNLEKIEELAAQLRNHETLHQQGMYVHMEVIRRTRKKDGGSRGVSLLSAVCHEIDETHEFDVDGKTTNVYELGDRIDRLNQKAPGLGFTYTGDNHGVVLRGIIRESANQNLLPYLRDDTEYLVAQGEQIHRLTDCMGEALRRDFPTNPDADQTQAIYRSLYTSTRDHEQHHKEDELRKVQSRLSFPDTRIAQETTAYLASMAARPEDAEPHTPFADLVKIIQLHIAQSNDLFAGFADMHRIYQKASGRILCLIADELQSVSMDEKALQEDPVEACYFILKEALKLDRHALRALATKVLAEEITRQKGARGQLSKLESRKKLGDDQTTPVAVAEYDRTYVPETPLGRKTIRRNMREAVFAATLIGAVAALKESTTQHTATTDPIEMSASPSREPATELPELVLSPSRPNTGIAEIVSTPTVFPPRVDNDGLHMNNPPKEATTFDREKLTHEPTDRERQSFKRGIWGYAELILRDHGLRKKTDTKYDQKINELVDIFLAILEEKGMVTNAENGRTWNTPVYGEGIDAIIQALRLEVSKESH